MRAGEGAAPAVRGAAPGGWAEAESMAATVREVVASAAWVGPLAAEPAWVEAKPTAAAATAVGEAVVGPVRVAVRVTMVRGSAGSAEAVREAAEDLVEEDRARED